MNHKGETVLSTVYGKNLSTEEPIEKESRYLLPLEYSSMLALCAFILIDEGKLRLSDKISKFIPEFEHADKITIRHLLSRKRGIRDFYFGEIRRTLDEDNEYSSLSDFERRKRDMELYLRDYSFETVLNSIKGKELEHEPGTSGDFSAGNTVFLKEIIERVSGISAREFIKLNIFEKLRMENTDYPFFTTTLSDLEKLILGIFEHRVFSEKLFKTATKFDSENIGLCFENLNGYPVFFLDFESFSPAIFYFDKENDFCRLLVSGALETIAYACAQKNHRLFVETEGEKAVGLLELSIDRKKGDYYIETVIIDRRYQGRGFGKFMLRFAVDYLKKAGAKKLSIGVNRFNIPAQKLYKSAGFKEDCVYEEGIFMTRILSED